MAKHSTAPRSIYTSPEGRIEIVRYSATDHDLFLDSTFVKSFRSKDAAMHHAAMWLEEQAQRVAVYQEA